MLIFVKSFYKDITIIFLLQIYLPPYLCPVQMSEQRELENKFKHF